MKVALIGQPNCGKSTLFNSVVGYRSQTSNLSGTTVHASVGRARLNGAVLELVDLPGTYSFTASNPAEDTTREWLWESRPDVIINVVDASLLSRSLELTFEIFELGIPVVLCLNMMDEARRKGIRIDLDKLSAALGIPVAACVAPQGIGIDKLFAAVRDQMHRAAASAVRWSADVERAIVQLEAALSPPPDCVLPRRAMAISLVEQREMPFTAEPAVVAQAERIRGELAAARGRDTRAIIMGERHDNAMRVFEEAATVGHPRPDIRSRIDDLLTHPVLGYLFLLSVLLVFFWAVFGLGSALETAMQSRLASVFAAVNAHLSPGTLTTALVTSAWEGLVGGAAIVLPYLVPFLFGLALLEDTGYLPRVAYLTDGLLHRLGLHGSSVLPLLLGYGCTVPACLATRVLPSRRDRFLAGILAMLVPCSARSNVIFALVGFYLGPLWALTIFGINFVVVIVSGWLLARLWPEVAPGMILDVPRYQMPQPKIVARKVWLRTREFIFLSWPLLIGGSVALGAAAHYGWDRWINLGLRPLTLLLGLPAAVGVVLVFGILRKELSLIMLMQALGTIAVGRVLTTPQLVTFTIFVVFYMPCAATIATMSKELGAKLTAAAAAYSLAIAIAVAGSSRIVLALFAR